MQSVEGLNGETARRSRVSTLAAKASVESNMDADLVPFSMVSMHASTANPNGHGFHVRSSNRTCGVPASGSRTSAAPRHAHTPPAPAWP